jgi:hypothetical protein
MSIAQKYVTDGKMERVIEEIFARSEVDYVHVNRQLQVVTFRIERQDRLITEHSETQAS